MCSQHVVSRNYSLKDGLPSTETYHIISDHSGFIWFSSDAGLCKFNGYSFRTYSIKDGLPETTLFNLYEDSKGRIWFSTLKSSIGYIYHDSVFVLKKTSGFFTDRNGRTSYVSSFHVDSGDTLWIGTSGNGYLLKVSPPFINSLPAVVINHRDYIMEFEDDARHESVSGVMLSNNRPELNVLSGIRTTKGTVFEEKHLPIPEKSSSKYIVRHPRGFLVIAIGDKIYVSEGDKCRFVKALNGFVIDVSIDKRGIVWVSQGSHGIDYFRDISSSDQSVHLFGETKISSAALDFEGCYWFSSLDRGVLYMPSLDFTVTGPEEGLEQKRINAVNIVSADILLAQSYAGDLYMVDHKKLIKLPTLGLSLYSSPFYPYKVFYTGTQPGYLDLTDRKLHRVLQADKLNWFINHYATGPDGVLYGSYTYSLLKLNEKLELKSFLKLKERITTFLVDSKGVFWIGTLSGLQSYDEKHGLIQWGKSNPLLGKRVDMISEDKTGHLWLATRGNGVLVFDKHDKVEVIDQLSGLPSDFCRTLFIDSMNSTWVGTNSGLSRIEGKNRMVTNYSFLNDLCSGEINDIKRTGNDLWVACSEGVFRYAVDQLESLRQNPPIFITGATTTDKSSLTDGAVLSYDENFVRFSFLGLSYFEAGKLTYAYKLDGADREWRHTSGLVAEYTTLPPGDYCFTVKPEIGIQSVANTAVFRFRITPPFWKTIGFIAILIFFILATTTFIFIYSIRRVKRKARIKITIANLEATALRAQMNPHFIFNAINSIQNFILKNERKPAHEFLTKFSRLIRNVLEFSKSDFIALSDEIQTLDLYIQLEKLRASDRFEFEINVDPALSEHYLIPSMVLQPFIENAIIHGLLARKGTDGFLSIRFTRADEKMKCVIEDNGIGRMRAAEIKGKKQNYHRSMGLSVTADRLDVLRKVNHFNATCQTEDLFDDNGDPAGTRVVMMFPIKYAHQGPELPPG
jgi:hypothetical protein